MEKLGVAAGVGVVGDKNQEFSFRRLEFKMFTGHPSGDSNQRIQYMALELRGEAQT